MADIQTFRDALPDLIQDDSSRIGTEEIDRFIQRAVKQYNKDRPRELVVDTTGDGTSDYAIMAGFVDGFSEILSVEHPEGEEPPQFLAIDAEPPIVFVYRRPNDVIRLRFDGVTPTTAEVFRTTFTAPHTVSETASTIFTQDEEALTFLAASYALRALAVIFAHTSDPSLDADVTDYEAKAALFNDKADDMQKNYREQIGKGDADIKGANFNQDQDVDFQWGGDKLFHPRRLR